MYSYKLLFFLQYCILGSINPIFSLYLKQDLGFTGTAIGIIMSASSVSAVLAPLGVTALADRKISTRNLLLICNLLIGVILLVLVRQLEFWPILVAYLVFMTAMNPSTGLLNSFTLARLENASGQFTAVRVWGTYGWMGISFFSGYFWLGKLGGELSGLFYIGMTLAFLMAGVMLFFPSLPLDRSKKISIFPREIVRFFLEPDILFVSGICFLVMIVLRFYMVGTSIYLRQGGVPESWIMPLMSIGQVAEILIMLTFGKIVKKVGFRKLLALGVFFEILRYSFFAAGNSPVLYCAGIFTHGIAFPFVTMTAMIYLDYRAGAGRRSGTQQIFAMLTMGLGSFFGNTLAGRLLDVFVDEAGQTIFFYYWLVPAGISLLIFGVILLFGRRMGMKDDFVDKSVEAV